VFFKLPPKLVAKETHTDDLVMWYVQTTIVLPIHNNYSNICTVYHYYYYFVIELYLLFTTIILCYIPELSWKCIILRPPHLKKHFCTATTNFISTNNLWAFLNVFNNPSIFLYMLY